MSRIILDCDLMRHPNSGLYHYCLNLGNHVSRLMEEEGTTDRLFYYAPPAENRAFERPKQVITERRKLHRFFRPFMAGCLLWHAPFQSGRMFPAPKPGLKVLLTIHDLNCLHEGKPADEVKRSLAHTQRLIDRSDAIVCISEFCRQDVISHCRVGDKPVYVIHNGVHRLDVPPAKPQAYHPARPFFFGMGYVNRKKNFHVLLPLLQSGDHELVVAGRLDEPDYIAGMRKQAEALGVSDRVRILGPVSESDKSWYMANCTAYLHPSLAEGFGAPVVEAMTFGKPLFLARRTSLPEIGADAAFYFDRFDPDHMKRVLAEGMQVYNSNGLSEVIRKRAEQFDWREKARLYLSVYQSLIHS